MVSKKSSILLGNQYWFGLRKPPCQFLFGVCPCLQVGASYNPCEKNWKKKLINLCFSCSAMCPIACTQQTTITTTPVKLEWSQRWIFSQRRKRRKKWKRWESFFVLADYNFGYLSKVLCRPLLR